MRTIPAVVAALAMSGCASQDMVWRKHGAGPGTAEQDRGQCAYEAELRLITYTGPSLPRARSVGEAFAQGIVQGIDIEMRKATLVNACMQARGYHLAPIATAAPPPAVPRAAVAEPPIAPPYEGQAIVPVATPVTYSDPRERMNLPAEAPREPHPSFTQGQWAFIVEKMAKSQSCEPKGNAKIIANGPGFEHYSVSCSDGEALAVRCDHGNCRVLK